MTMNDRTLILAMRGGPCDLGSPHAEAAEGKSAEARSVIAKIKNAGGRELHLCQECCRAMKAEARREYRFAEDVA